MGAYLENTNPSHILNGPSHTTSALIEIHIMQHTHKKLFAYETIHFRYDSDGGIFNQDDVTCQKKMYF
jgi:hypothetical protein